MPIRFHRILNIIPGVRVNVSKGGLSTSVGPRGADINFGKRGVTTNAGLPGTGLSYRQTLGKPGSWIGIATFIVALALSAYRYGERSPPISATRRARPRLPPHSSIRRVRAQPPKLWRRRPRRQQVSAMCIEATRTFMPSLATAHRRSRKKTEARSSRFLRRQASGARSRTARSPAG